MTKQRSAARRAQTRGRDNQIGQHPALWCSAVGGIAYKPCSSNILGAAPTGEQRRLRTRPPPILPLPSQPSSALHVARTPPPPNPADADDARPLGASATHSKNWQNIASRRAMMLAGWPPGIVHGGPETRHSLGNGCETRARSRAAQRKNEGPMQQGRRHCCGFLLTHS